MAITHFLAGLWGLISGDTLIVFIFFRYSFVLPSAAFLYAVFRCWNNHPCGPLDFQYLWPDPGHDPRAISQATVIFSLVAIAAIVAAGKRMRIGSVAVFALLSFLIPATLWPLVGDLITAKLSGFNADILSGEYIWPLLWSISCAFAYCFIRPSR